MNPSQLSIDQLDWSTAKIVWGSKYPGITDLRYIARRQRYSSDPSTAYPLITQYGISAGPSVAGLKSWVAGMPLQPPSVRDRTRSSGPTPLIAAMRCLVAFELGDDIDIPEGL